MYVRVHARMYVCMYSYYYLGDEGNQNHYENVRTELILLFL